MVKVIAYILMFRVSVHDGGVHVYHHPCMSGVAGKNSGSAQCCPVWIKSAKRDFKKKAWCASLKFDVRCS